MSDDGERDRCADLTYDQGIIIHGAYPQFLLMRHAYLEGDGMLGFD